MCQIRAEKFDLVLPTAMHDNDVDMWIVVMREGNLDPLWEALGRGYVGGWAYYAFADRGERVERAAFGVGGYMLEACGVYDLFGSGDGLAAWVAAHDPDRIADLGAYQRPEDAEVLPLRRPWLQHHLRTRGVGKRLYHGAARL